MNVFSAEGTRKFFPTLRNELWASSFSVTFRAGAVYENLRGPAFTAGLLTVGERTAVLCFSPSADLSAAPARFRQGDLLICRAGIPAGVDPAAFGGVIVMTDKSAAALRLPENAVATADTGGIAIRIR